MQTVLGNVNTIPGVVGSMLCDPQGRILAQVFPPAFDEEVLREAAAAVADGALGLESATGPTALIDLRYGSARVLAKPIPGALLLLLCTRSINLQLAMMSVSVVGRRLEQMIRAAEPAPGLPRRPAQPDRGEAASTRSAEPAARRPDPPPSKKGMSWWPSV